MIQLIMKKINYPQFKKLPKFTDVDDLYICAMGFEDRSLGSNQHLLENNFRAKKTLAIKYDSYVKENEKYKNELESIWNKFSETISYVVYTTNSRNDAVKNLRKELESYGLPLNSVTVNITSFKTHIQLWLLNFILDNAKKVRVVYTEPEGYGNQLESDTAFSSGVKEIFTMSEFSGAILPGYSTLLVIFLGYDFVRARGTYEQIQPSKKIGILAEPNTENLQEHYTEMETRHRISFASSDSIVKFSIFDLESVINGLDVIRVKHIESSNICIAVNGSKLHTISAMLFAKKFKDVQIVVSTPIAYYPNNYSFGVGRTFELNVDKIWITNFTQND